MKTDGRGWTAEEYRNALDNLELALTNLGIVDLVRSWGEPRHRPELGVSLKTNCGTVYRIHDAYMVANRMMNNAKSHPDEEEHDARRKDSRSGA